MTTDKDLEREIAAVRQRTETANRARARAEAERDVAVRDLRGAREQMASEFGVASADEARAVAAQLEAEVVAEVNRVNELLEQARGSAGV